MLELNDKKVDQQIYVIVLRKNNERQSAVIAQGTMDHCLSYVESFYPNFKRDDYNTNYFYKTRGKGMNGEIFIKPINAID